MLGPAAGAEVELEGGRKHRAKMVVCADGVHSKTAAKYHKAPLQFTKIIGWRCALRLAHPLSELLLPVNGHAGSSCSASPGRVQCVMRTL